MENPGSLSVYYCNARSIRNKFNDLILLSSSFKYDILAISESWLHLDTVDSSEYFQVPGYVRVNKDRVGRIGGGVLLFLKSDLKFAILENEHAESIWLKLIGKNACVIFGLVYRPNDLDDIQIANDINNFAKFSQTCIVGDFNLPAIDWINMCSNSPNLVFKATLDNFLVQKVSEMTRNNNLLDLVFCSSFELVDNLDVIDPLSTSDHRSIKFDLKFNKPEIRNIVKKPNFKKANFEEIRSDISFLNNDDFFALEGPVTAFNTLMNTIKDSQNIWIPFAKAGKCSDKPWVTQSLKSKIGLKRSLYKRAKVNPDLFARYKVVQNELKTQIFIAKLRYENRLADISKSNPSAFFKYYRSNNKESIIALNENGERISENHQIGNVLNKYFASVFSQRTDDFIINVNRNPLFPSMDQVVFTTSDILIALNKLSAHKSVGPDFVYARTLVETKFEIAPILTHIFNAFLEFAYVPDEWKIADVIPIFKKGNKECKENYRPISLTSVMCKLMECIIVNKLTLFLESNNLLTPYQHGFRKGKSCVTNLIMFYDKVTKCVDSGGSYDILFLDFSKAFDKIPHSRLLDKLYKFNVDPRIVKWIEEWLSNRRQRVLLNGEYTDWLPVTSGVPQGSCLGPLLFVLFINDFGNNMVSDIGLFADDAKLGREIQTIDDFNKLQGDLDLATLWCEYEGMILNPDKCVVMHFGKNNPHFEYTINNRKVKLSQEQSDLGVMINENLSFSNHCTNVRNKATRVVSFIKQSVSTRNPETMIKLFSALVRPILEYAAQFWSPHLIRDIDLIENVQRSFTRLINNFQMLNYEERLNELNLFSLQYRRERGQIIETFKFFKNSPDSAQILFSFPASSRTRGHAHKIENWRFKTEMGRYSFSNRVVKLWNSLPSELVEADSVEAFKRPLDEELSDFRGNLKYS